MLQQITNTETLDTLSVTSGQAGNAMLFIVVGICVIVVAVYLLFFLPKKLKDDESKYLEIKAKNRGNGKSFKKSGLLNQPVAKKDEAKVSVSEQEPQASNKISILEKKIKLEQRQDVVKSIPKSIIIKPEKEEQLKVKHIGYNPINIFAQTEPLSYPYVVMPKPNSVIKFPRKGRNGRKGYKEDDFKVFIDNYFKNNFQVYNDRFVLAKNSPNPYEPDFTLIDEKEGINIFLDVEIDEPYEGLNDLETRKATHYQYSDINRNNAFKNRGWMVIRFAEIQVHQNPDSCCRFISDVIKSINIKFLFPESLRNVKKLTPLLQWSKEEAEKWSAEKYREKYLGITNFGHAAERQTLTDIVETELGEQIEEKVQDEIVFIPVPSSKPKTTNVKLEKIYSAINSGLFLSFKVNGSSTITKPIKSTETKLTAFCFVKNKERIFNIYELSELNLKNNYFTLKVAGPTIGIEQITSAINTAIEYQRFIRMKYTRSSWTNMIVDRETGELIIDRIEAEESIRTINDVQLSINVLAQDQINTYNLNGNYLTAYCNKKDELRTFRFDRIGEIEILDL